jgi:hypothetical protein
MRVVFNVNRKANGAGRFSYTHHNLHYPRQRRRPVFLRSSQPELPSPAATTVPNRTVTDNKDDQSQCGTR